MIRRRFAAPLDGFIRFSLDRTVLRALTTAPSEYLVSVASDSVWVLFVYRISPAMLLAEKPVEVDRKAIFRRFESVSVSGSVVSFDDVVCHYRSVGLAF